MSAAIANIIKGDKDAISKSFHKALPNFVKLTPVEPDPGSPPASPAPASALPALPVAASPTAKGKPGKPIKVSSGAPRTGKSRAAQLSLI